MPQFYLPSIGDKIELTEDWEFPLHFEYRNESMITRIKPNQRVSYSDEGSMIAVLEKGTVLRVARIYIRQGKREWDSITFGVVSAPNDESRAKIQKAKTSFWASDDKRKEIPNDEQKYKGARFWVKLADANEIQYEKVKD